MENKILDNIRAIQADFSEVKNLLTEANCVQEAYALNFNSLQTIKGILANTDHVQMVTQQTPGYEMQLRDQQTAVHGFLQQNSASFQTFMEQFQYKVISNVSKITVLQNHITSERIELWKYEQQKQASGVHHITSNLTSDHLQTWCEHLAETIWKMFEQLTDSKRIINQGIIVPFENSVYLAFVEGQEAIICGLLQQLLNNSLIVEKQPPQVIHQGTQVRLSVEVTLLVGKTLSIHMKPPELSVSIISEEQAKSLEITNNKVTTIGKVINGKASINMRNPSGRVSFVFENMIFNDVIRGNGPDNVMKKKLCLYFECLVTVGPLNFKVYTISLPLLVTKHSSQDIWGRVCYLWDNAFAEFRRVPFQVPEIAPWSQVAELLSVCFRKSTGRGLTDINLDGLKNKVFGNRQRQPENIKCTEFISRKKMMGKDFSFLEWFHSMIYVMEKTDLNKVYEAGLIIGFIDENLVESLLANQKIGTFLIRFSDTEKGTITITYVDANQEQANLRLQLLQLQQKNLCVYIQEWNELKFLYKFEENTFISKRFLREENTEARSSTSNKKYVRLKSVIDNPTNRDNEMTGILQEMAMMEARMQNM